ncbi:MAG: GTPase ObgE, partial [Sulfurospirillum sp.]|nr:GTPase ObgE [Sulfurospirillum sp.]
LTRCDTLTPEEINEKVNFFLNLLSLKRNDLAQKYKAREDLHSYCQDVYERDGNLPFFVIPLSSVSKINVDPIKYALSDVIRKVRDEESRC